MADDLAQQRDYWFGAMARGMAYAPDWSKTNASVPVTKANPLRDYFKAHREGRGIWKWDHYFDIYDRHFSKFRGKNIHMLEIGVFEGGSLEMWRDYFGPHANIYGMDISPACKRFEVDGVKIFIGDQADRNFWKTFKEQVPVLDIVLDDGGHEPEQQAVTLEELLPHVRAGGVYLCEDIHGGSNGFSSMLHGLAHKLNDFTPIQPDPNQGEWLFPTTPFQAAVGAMHFYPYVSVVERNETTVTDLISSRQGSPWKPPAP